MPKKLTKDQKYHRKQQRDSRKDFRKVPKEGSSDGHRVTRKSTVFRVSTDAAERFKQMAKDVGITQWQMATRMIQNGLPGIQSSGYGSFDSFKYEYEWNEAYLNPPEKKIRYKGTKGEVQLNLSITTTMWKKLTCHSNATQRSKSRIFQELCLTYKPLSPEFLEKQRQKYADDKNDLESSRIPLPDEHLKRLREAKNSKFQYLGDGFYVHKKNIPYELWDEAEIEEYERLIDSKAPYHHLSDYNH
jgi:hypothetical protein